MYKMTKLYPYVSYEFLKNNGACEERLAVFKKLFGKGASLTKANCARMEACDLYFLEKSIGVTSKMHTYASDPGYFDELMCFVLPYKLLPMRPLIKHDR